MGTNTSTQMDESDTSIKNVAYYNALISRITFSYMFHSSDKRKPQEAESAHG